MPLPTSEEILKMTPMMQQYFNLKSQAENTIMFFRMGDFFEVFGEDAIEIAPILEIVLTSRERGDKNKIPFCGVPHHAAKNYWLKLLKKGFKISIADQVEAPSEAKGLVRREIIKIITPGCIDEIEGLPGDMPNYIMAAYEDPKSKKWAVAVTDISTGELRLGQLENIDQVKSCVAEFCPKELLLRRFVINSAKEKFATLVEENGLMIDELPENCLTDENEQNSLLKETFGKTELDHFPCCINFGGKIIGGKEIISSLFVHLKNLKTNLATFRTVDSLSDPETMTLGDTLVRDLELFETVRRRESKGSLFRQIDRTLSPMGARLSRWSFSRPLLKEKAIVARHDSVELLANLGEEQLSNLRSIVKGSFDLERLTTRVLSGSAHPAELSKIRVTLQKVKSICEFIEQSKIASSKDLHFVSFLSELKNFCGSLNLLEQALIDIPENLGKGDLVFKTGYDKSLDELISLSQNGKAKVADYEAALRKETDITSLKVKTHKTFGLLVEVTKSNISKIPESFIRRQTMVNCERFVTNELKDLDEVLSSALENSIEKERILYQELLGKIASHAKEIYQVAHGLAQIDMLQSFAWLAIKENYCRPKVTSKKIFELKNSRHPVVEHFVGKHQYVANSISMNAKRKHLLITGPNMAGKSTVMRQTAICAILNQAGCFVPAESAVMPIFDQIYTRVGASDDLSRGQSTFMVEMSEAADILRQATVNSLVILDEVGRGTSTQDGLAIASAILESLATDINCWSLFATHYHELADVANRFDHIQNMKTEVVEKKNGIEFSHRLKEGVSGSSFGIEVAKLAGIPEKVIQKAQEFLLKSNAALESSAVAQPKAQLPEINSGLKTQSSQPETKSEGQLSLGFDEIEAKTDDQYSRENNKRAVAKANMEDESSSGSENNHKNAQKIHMNANYEQIRKVLSKLNMNHMTPMKAFTILNEIKELSSENEKIGFFDETFVLNEPKPH